MRVGLLFLGVVSEMSGWMDGMDGWVFEEGDSKGGGRN